MVDIRLHRLGVEALLDAPPQIAVERASYEVAALQGGSGSVRLHRMAVEVLAKKDPILGVQRASYEAAALAGGSGPVQLHRLALEALLGNLPSQVAVERMSYEAAALAGGSGAIRLHRMAVEVLGRTGVPDPVPLPLAADNEFFMHNWADELEMETSYLTDVGRSPDTLAEERRSLIQRPERVLTLRWLRASQTEVYQLRLLARRMTFENLQIPLYQDASTLTASAGVIDTTFSLDLTGRRFFRGARVLFCRSTSTYVTRTAAIIRTITSLAGAAITVDSATGVDMQAGEWDIVPLIDIDYVDEPEIEMLTDRVASVSLTVREHRGENSLPPIAVSVAPGFPFRLGRSVFEIQSNWARGIVTRYVPQGGTQRIGRKLVPYRDGTRYAQRQDWDLAPIQRKDFERVLGHFDAMRGRSKSFWTIDQERELTLALTSSAFIDVNPFGRFEDFDQLWTEAGVAAAIKMRDGTIYLVQINTVLDNGSTWRLTIVAGQALPPVIDLTQVDYFARARISRFFDDVMRESWSTREVCSVRLSTIEAQNERNADF